jgi:hypothetical protein
MARKIRADRIREVKASVAERWKGFKPMTSTQYITNMARAFVAAEIGMAAVNYGASKPTRARAENCLTTILLSLNRRCVGQSRTLLIGAADASATCAATQWQLRAALSLRAFHRSVGPPHDLKTRIRSNELCPLWAKSGFSATQKQCPLWVRSRHVQRKKACPLYPRKRPRKRTLIGVKASCTNSAALGSRFDHIRMAGQALH